MLKKAENRSVPDFGPETVLDFVDQGKPQRRLGLLAGKGTFSIREDFAMTDVELFTTRDDSAVPINTGVEGALARSGRESS